MDAAAGFRPSTVVAATLAVLFVIACPQSLTAVITAAAWLLTDPAGAVLLGVALALSLTYCALTKLRFYTVRA